MLFSIAGYSGLKAQCPVGQGSIAVYACDVEFHRPKYNCEKGFWFCFLNCHWEKRCLANSTTGSTGFLYAKIVKEKYVEFHFPNEYIDKQHFTAEEKSVFNVDDPLIFEFEKQKVQLITGDYPTKQEKQELTVLVPFRLL